MRVTVGLGIALMVLGCGGGGDTQEADAGMAEEAAVPARVTITQPADGALVDAGPVLFVMETEGLEIVEAGNMNPGTGHHHLVVNGDIDWALPIPNDPGVHYHMGLAQTEFTIEDLTPGEHRIISVVADGVHIPVDPPVADTITITVR
ncbi:MAG: DUF4399 domain-containing protein [Gemmatimonadetes bacterium]|nr:DUF4399 domain-containing protein [Gemmatimonadota bacterium]MXX71130.1 DUF4399 domain-containing protein [Gemmatimonadota bacterium]MYC92693.1 DUF4399 domain-containing protein [Gemmatimonadota bacterium]MYG34450.1 DUF4399 domain-containing protein [Gemmatimonadota bacterium]MYJ16940.1 DUF4399 domain-containing protein [Gemmatimonadota bacterium]